MFDATVFLPSAQARDAPLARGTLRPASLFEPRRVNWSNHKASEPLRGSRGVKRLGLAYERRVLDVLTAIYGTAFRAQPCIEYLDRGRMTAAFPDGILQIGASLWILEVKLRHTPAVWPQLMERYLPLVRHLEPRARISTVEICRSYDPGVLLPGRHTLIDSLHRSEATMLEVLQWKI